MKQQFSAQKQHGGDIYSYPGLLDFSVNVNPFGPAKAVLEAAVQGVLEMEQYPDPACRNLRTALAAKLCVPEEWLVFGNGAAELIFSLVQAEKPKKAVLAAPAFSEYEQALLAADCRICFHMLQSSENFDLGEAYLESLTEDVDLIFLCSPNNPTGRTIQPALLKRILELCQQKQIRVVLDECFLEFVESPGTAAMPSLVKEYPQLVLLRAFTKIYAMPGLRLGYLFSSDRKLLERLSNVRPPWNVSTAAQAAGLAALQEETYVEQTRKYVAEERRWMERQLERLGISYVPSEANYILFRSEQELFEALQKQGILIRDCGNYRGLGPGYYRTAVRKRADNEKLLEALKQICQIGGSDEKRKETTDYGRLSVRANEKDRDRK